MLSLLRFVSFEVLNGYIQQTTSTSCRKIETLSKSLLDGKYWPPGTCRHRQGGGMRSVRWTTGVEEGAGLPVTYSTFLREKIEIFIKKLTVDFLILPRSRGPHWKLRSAFDTGSDIVCSVAASSCLNGFLSEIYIEVHEAIHEMYSNNNNKMYLTLVARNDRCWKDWSTLRQFKGH